jgi:transcriptional regulator with XRE-family HTH domain
MAGKRYDLAGRRAVMGFTQEALAELLDVRATTVSRWECGQVTPAPWIQPRLAKALGVSRNELTQLLATRSADRADIVEVARTMLTEIHRSGSMRWEQTNVLAAPWSALGTMQVLHQLAGGAMDRRDFLTVTTGALAGLASSSLATPPLSLSAGSVSPAVLDRLDSRLADLRTLDDQLGGGTDLRHLVVAELRLLTQVADRCDYDSVAGRRLFSLIAEAGRLCGWVHVDAADHEEGQSYYVAALRSSVSADDPMTGASILKNMADQAVFTGHHQQALALLDAAEQRTKDVTTPRLRALLATHRARSHAMAGDAKSCGRALNDAERHVDNVTATTSDPTGIYYFDEAEFRAQAATCWVFLRQPGKARPLIDSALARMSPQCLRERAIYHVRSSEAHLQADELDMACGELHRAADLAGRSQSLRAVRTIRSVRTAMFRHNAEPRVKALDRHLNTLPTNSGDDYTAVL